MVTKKDASRALSFSGGIMIFIAIIMDKVRDQTRNILPRELAQKDLVFLTMAALLLFDSREFYFSLISKVSMISVLYYYYTIYLTIIFSSFLFLI